MGKKEKSKSKFAEALDPRFMGIFKSDDINGNGNKNSISNVNESHGKKESIGDLQNIVSKAMNEYFESNIKYVGKEIDADELIKLETDNDVTLFPGDFSKHVLDAPSQAVQPKKKRKKEKIDEDELIKQVVVTPDWIFKQAALLNS